MPPTEHIHTDLTVLYPAHPPRKETPLYVKSHHRMIYDEDRPCYVCGVRHSTIGDPAKNPFKAKALETHHFLVEDSLANAIDLDKWNAIERPALARHHPDKYDQPFTQNQFLEWVHGDEDNLLVVCDQHHRNTKVGIHAIPWPIYRAQFLLKTGYNLTGFVAHSPQEAAALTALPMTTGTATPPPIVAPTP